MCGCVCVCVCVCVTTLRTKRTDLKTWTSACRSSGRISRSKVKGQGNKVKKCFNGYFNGMSPRDHRWFHGWSCRKNDSLILLRCGVFSKRMRFLLYRVVELFDGLDSLYMAGGKQEAGGRTGFPRTDVGSERARVSKLKILGGYLLISYCKHFCSTSIHVHVWLSERIGSNRKEWPKIETG